MMSSSSGLVVSDAAVASPTARDHQAIVCRSRGRAVGPVTARQTPRLRRAATALPALATTRSPSTPQVRAARTRAGLSACRSAASEGALGTESPADSEAEPEGSPPALVGESLGDSLSSASSAATLSPVPGLFAPPAFPAAAVRRESAGDSLASGDGEGDADVADGLADGLEEGLDDGLEPEPPD